MTLRAVPIAALLCLLSLTSSLAAQEISGLAVDGDGRPLPGVPVALHRIGGTGGATVDASTTDAAGRFRFDIEAPDSALYFVAIRHDDRLFIGPPARAGGAPIMDYRVVAEPAAEAGAVASALAGGGTGAAGARGPGLAGTGLGGDAGGLGGAGMQRLAWIVALLALAAAAMFVTAAPGYRERQRRTLLAELADVERRAAGIRTGAAAAGVGTTGAAADHSDEERHEASRRALVLRQRLAPRS